MAVRLVPRSEKDLPLNEGSDSRRDVARKVDSARLPVGSHEDTSSLAKAANAANQVFTAKVPAKPAQTASPTRLPVGNRK